MNAAKWGLVTIPTCTNLTSPINGATNVPVTSALTWAVSANATGYKLTVGTTSGGTDILNNFDVGNVTTFNPGGDFPYNTTIYVKIVPYNANGDAVGCAEESFTTESNTCPTGDITFSTQVEINNFSTNYPGCTEIMGNVCIGDCTFPNTNSNISNLNGLSQLTTITGDIYIQHNPNLINFAGLENITSVGGQVNIVYNDALTSLSGLSNLSSIDELIVIQNDALTNISGLTGITNIGNLFIAENDALVNFSGLDNVTNIGGDVTVLYNNGLTNFTGLNNVTSIGGNVFTSANPVLTNFTGLNNVASIGGYLEISFNNALTNFLGLGNVTSIGSYVRINGNTALTSFLGLNSLTAIGHEFYVYDNPVLTDLTNLSNLTTIAGELYFGYNNDLTSLHGLDNIDHTTITNLTIESNPLLSLCDVQSICDYLAVPSNPATISGNATGCASRVEVEAACVMAPSNNDCANAIEIPVSTSNCTPSGSYSTIGATSSMSNTCMNGSYRDTWYKFLTPANVTVVILENSSFFTVGKVEVFDACGGTSIYCDFIDGGQPESFYGLQENTWYWIRIGTQASQGEGIINLCLKQYISTSLSVTTTPACAGNDGTVTGTVTGGQSPYDFFLSSGNPPVLVDMILGDIDGIVTFTGLSPGTYLMEVYDLFSSDDYETFDIQSCQPSNNDCANAINLPVNSSSCTPGGSYSTVGATNSLANACMSSIYEDTWYKFTPTTAAVTLEGDAFTNIKIELFDGCGGASLTCEAKSSNFTLNWSALTVGQEYFFRIGVISGEGILNLCLREYVPPLLSVTTTPACSGNDGTVTGTVTGGQAPYDFFLSNGDFILGDLDGVVTFTGLSLGTYLMEVYDLFSSDDYETFDIQDCQPSNDDCINAINLPVNSSSCTPGGNFSTIGATNSLSNSCMGSLYEDTWYQFTPTTSEVTLEGSGFWSTCKIELFDGCGGNSISCASRSTPFSVTWSGLNIDSTYWYRIGVLPSQGEGEIDMCIWESIILPPLCTALTTPLNAATNVPITTALTWATAPTATGYRLTAGTTPSGTDILNNVDVGNVTTYNPAGDFPSNTTIYVKIVPYNANGNAVGCAEESFTTETVVVGCLPGGIIFSTQAQIDAFPTNYPGCTTILGDVTIEECCAGAIMNLNGLSQITSIDGGLFIYNTPQLTNLNGLLNLTSINGPLEILNNQILVSLNGIQNINAAGIAHLSIVNNQSLDECDVQSVCNYLNLPMNVSTVFDNLGNCESIPIILVNCPATVPACVNLTNPLNGATSVPVTSGLSWVAAPNATGYKLTVGTTPGGTDILNNFDVGNVTTYNPAGDFPYTTTIYVKITPYNAIGDATGCTEESFTTESPQCPPGDVTLLTQAEVDAFAMMYPTCTQINGNLTIGNFGNNSDIDDLSGLSSLTTANNVYVYSNPLLTDLTGLNNFTTIPSELFVFGNNGLANLTGLGSLNNVGGIKIAFNNNLINLVGLGNITGLPLDLQINFNPALTSLAGLSNLAFTGLDLGLTYNNMLSDLTALGNLDSIGGHLNIGYCPALASLAGLQNLTVIDNDLTILNNAILASLLDLTGLETIGGNLEINGNPLLSSCEAQAICDYLASPPGTVTIQNNASGCNSQAEVQANCPPPCTHLTNPINGATDVPSNTALTWAASTTATGYKLSIGTTPGGTDILNNVDVGNVTTYDPTGNLPYNVIIYVKITPYNAIGDADSCAEESFTTGSCIPNLLVVSNPVPAGAYHSLGDLISHSSTVANGTAVIFTSDTGILLDYNFTVESGATFHAYIQACNNFQGDTQPAKKTKKSKKQKPGRKKHSRNE